jgi:signal transduction histidine kinase
MEAKRGSMTEYEDKLRRLLDVGRSLIGELDPEAVLDQILNEARDITGARYAALGVVDRDRSGLSRFLNVGVDESAQRAIGNLPRGRGVLGVLIDDPRPLRMADVGLHPQSYGFPPGHPPMRTFLGVPIMLDGEAWGNLYLTEKQGGAEFTEADQDAVVVLAQWAAIAIQNARVHEGSERGRAEAERAVRGLEAARDIADAIAGVDELDRVLELIVKRGRALISARAVLIMLREGDELVIAACAGHATDARGRRLPISRSTSGEVLERGRAERIADVSSHLRIAPEELGVEDAHTALLVPMVHRGASIGVLAAFDRGPGGDDFTAADEQVLRQFATSAANAVTVRRSVEADRLRSAIDAADSERRRWARELHDQTLQSLGGLRVLLASTIARDDADAKDRAIRQAIEDIELEIENLRGIITDLRPSLLDDLGLLPAIEALVARRRDDGLEVVSDLALPESAVGSFNLTQELETTIYRLVQESLTNIIKHAQAKHVRVAVLRHDDVVVVEIQDDGVGFDPESETGGFGLPGMRERVYLAGGALELSSDGGTLVRARFPLAAIASADTGRSADQMVS